MVNLMIGWIQASLAIAVGLLVLGGVIAVYVAAYYTFHIITTAGLEEGSHLRVPFLCMNILWPLTLPIILMILALKVVWAVRYK